MRAYRKTGKAGPITWRLLSSGLILVLAGFPLAATGQSSDPSMGRPSVAAPIHMGTEIVGYSSARPGYRIRIYATGTPKRHVGEGLVTPWGHGSVPVERPLQIGETIAAVQVGDKTEGFRSSEIPVKEVTSLKERQLNKPTIDDPLFACQQGFWVSGLVEGVRIGYDATKAPGYLWTPAKNGFVIPGHEIQKTVKARQELPPYFDSEYATKAVKPSPLTSTSIKEEKYKPDPANTTLGSDVLKVDNLITGAKVDIYEGQPGERRKRIGGGIAMGSSTLFPIEPFTREGAWAEQSLCEGTLQSKSSDWAESKTDISPPTIDEPICAGATSVTVFTTEPGGNLKLQVKKKKEQQATFDGQGTAGTAGGRTVINYGNGKEILEDGDMVSVQHIKDSITSTPPAQAGVVLKSTPRFNIANGIPCDQCAGAGPRFVVGEAAGPIFTASMCGIERGVKPRVEIWRPDEGRLVDTIELEEVEENKGHFQKQWKKAFSPTELGTYLARLDIGKPSDDKYFYVTVQGCVNCSVVDFHQTCVDRINKLRDDEGVLPLMRDKAHEGCSDNDAKVNFEAKQSHKQMCHATTVPKTAGGQNECPLYADVNGILDDCIEDSMYDEESKCYARYMKKDPEACENDFDNNGNKISGCDCAYGHYEKMIKNAYTKVACGIYVTPEGGYKAVMNFW